jgi:hypothetical protein
LLRIRRIYFIVFNNETKDDITKLKSILNEHPKKATTPFQTKGSVNGLGVYLKCKNYKDLESTLKALIITVPNTTTPLVEYSGFLTPSASEQWKKSAKFAVYIYIATVASDAGINSWINQATLETNWSEFWSIFGKALVVGILPTVAALLLRKLND